MKKTMILPFILALFGLIQVACVKNDANIRDDTLLFNATKYKKTKNKR